MSRTTGDEQPPPLVMLIGSPRSGTSWIGRVFDSVPGTLYLHEPDMEIYDPQFPVVPDPEAGDELLPCVERLLSRLETSRPLRAVASRPIMRKPYRSTVAHIWRLGMIYGLRGIEEVVGRRIQRLRVPDLIDRPQFGPHTLVLKSVTALARLPFFAASRPTMPIVHLLRHPAGMVASELRGIRLGKMARPRLYDRQLALPPARRRGLDRSAVDDLPDLELLAWYWLIMNEWAMERCTDEARILRLNYDRFCANPIEEARAMLEFCGLSWCRETEMFLKRSLAADTVGKGYHSTIRNPALAANRWQHELKADEIDRVMAIAGNSLPGRLFAA